MFDHVGSSSAQEMRSKEALAINEEGALLVKAATPYLYGAP